MRVVTASQSGAYFDFAISRAALMSGASVRNGSESLKNGSFKSRSGNVSTTNPFPGADRKHAPAEAQTPSAASPRPPRASSKDNP